jgi:diguanylate cyclase (GGDEF)-like protein/hemerythrin-like metal-binding protein/PAS domain S-box-containing protein
LNLEPNELSILRSSAEARLVPAKRQGFRPADKLLHELQVHQIEIEIQNENLRQSQIDLEKSRDRYVEFYDFAPVGYLTLNRSACISELNLTCAALLGNDRGQFLQRRFSTLVAPEDRDRWHTYFMSVLQHDEKFTCELCILRDDGTRMEVQLDSLRHAENGKTSIVRIVLTDITERKSVEKRIKFLATHDRMTELPNRELFYDRLSQAISHSKRKSNPFTVFFLDLDGFKAINDIHGHGVGDTALKVVASRLQVCIREMDTVARIGGDEFAIILNDVGQCEDARNVAEKIVRSLALPIKLDASADCQIGVSIGIATYPLNGLEIDKLMHAADSAMYESKAHGNNRITFYSELADQQGAKEPWINLDSTKRVGVPLIDQQHEEMAELLNKLNTAFNSGEPTEIVSRILDDIYTYTGFHFNTEERLMDKYEYPGSPDHKREHQNLRDELDYLKKKFLGGGEAVVMQTLKNWFLIHIINFDKPFGTYLIDISALNDLNG